jgi:hypothetical protein
MPTPLHPNSRTPQSYQLATWRNALPPDHAAGIQGIAFTLADGTPVRLAITPACVQHLLTTLAPDYFDRVNAATREPDYLASGATGVQSAGASLMPNSPRSTPSEADQCEPTDASPAASSGVA